MRHLTAISNIILIITSILLALVLCEFIVRTMKLAPEVVYIEKWRMRLAQNPKIGFEPIPNVDSTGKSVQYYSYDGQSNDFGFRDYNHSLHKLAGSQRIAVIGDSVTAGLWVNDDTQVYPAVMEKSLRRKGINVDVMNFGVSGYNTQQEVETLKDKGLQFEPDLVILGYCLNDKWRDDGGIYQTLLHEQRLSAKGGKIPNTSSLNPLVKQSDLARFVYYSLLKNKNTASQGDDANKFDKDNVAEYFAELNNLSRTHGFETLILIFPDFGEQDANLKSFDTYPFAAEHHAIAQLASTNNLPYLDLYGIFQACHNSLGYNVSYDRYHPTPQGNTCAGNKIADHVATILRQ
ncbi:MAG: SGNH/GDSL hydrolase family protein [Halieaceae bacterium]|jgi:lysophospholipase L1-like esterase|nr:SGNH/GDSL hydrolase family protein [Halieaceae bacterium]